MTASRSRLFRLLATPLFGSALLLAACAAPASPPGFGLVVEGCPITGAALAQAGQDIGWPVSLVVFFLQWSEDRSAPFPARTVEAIQAAGAVPVVTWEPMTMEGGEEHAVNADDILSCRWDGYIDAFALAARENGGRIILRFAHEMNLARYHWGGDADAFGPESPARYRAMFRHVRDRFRQAGADNVLFAFCPNAESLPHPVRDGAAWNTAAAYYPGDDAVDVLGMDGYNWGTTFTRAKDGWDSRFTAFADIFGTIRRELQALSAGKPLVVFETASVTSGGDKAAWIRDAADTARRWNLAGLCWFQADKERDWRLGYGIDTSRLASLKPAFAAGRDELALPARAGGEP
ncbi:glycosyl hydrolase [Pseudodesulfovibrio sp.]|uniref:glycoside hydrolase family 26 protein n=1 Tax=Pseudodesulfovibrio sp. TaxID=2035812 RepID=UPI002637CBC0|nr:glycosyl hydrolase [Pseudodesulfovibrio sp.]MDD3310768.1 glycosyl hydrolase [Pseudodesulfovibrio sp.]